MSEKMWISRTEAASIIGLSKQTLSTMASMHMGPRSKKVGRSRVWNRESVEQYAADREKKRSRRTTVTKICIKCGQEFETKTSCAKHCPACANLPRANQEPDVVGPLYAKFGNELRTVPAKCPKCKRRYLVSTATWIGDGLYYKFCPDCQHSKAVRSTHYRENQQVPI